MESQIVLSQSSATSSNFFPVKKRKKNDFPEPDFELQSALAAVWRQDVGARARDGSLRF